MTTPLSPAAQAVLDAFNAEWPDGLAAALVAVADQVVPENANPVGDEHDESWLRIRLQLLAIAVEL